MSRSKYIGKAAFRLITLLIAVSVLSFVLMELSPVDPMTAYIGTDSSLSEDAKAEIAGRWGLNDSPAQRFTAWAGNFLKGDWGDSITYKKPVRTVILERFRYSAALIAVAWILSGVLGCALGMAAALKRGKLTDRMIKTSCLVLQSAPTFWLGLLILSLFAVKLQWFPIGLAVPMGKMASEVTISDRIYHMILPALTLSVLGIGKMALYTRQKLIEILDSNFVLYARARGESTGEIVRRHGLKNILLPVITLQFASFSELFGGIALAETVFSYPGIGSAVTAAGLNADVPLLLGIAVFSAVFVFAGNLIANVLYAALDPRIGEDLRREA